MHAEGHNLHSPLLLSVRECAMCIRDDIMLDGKFELIRIGTLVDVTILIDSTAEGCRVLELCM